MVMAEKIYPTEYWMKIIRAPRMNRMTRPNKLLSPPLKNPAPIMRGIKMIETINPANRAIMDGLIRSLSLKAIDQASLRKDQLRLKLCMKHFLNIVFAVV